MMHCPCCYCKNIPIIYYYILTFKIGNKRVICIIICFSGSNKIIYKTNNIIILKDIFSISSIVAKHDFFFILTKSSLFLKHRKDHITTLIFKFMMSMYINFFHRSNYNRMDILKNRIITTIISHQEFIHKITDIK